MPTAAAFEKEKLEVEAVMASGIFHRAPNLAHLLKYVCEKYFDGAAEEIKEYNIAIDALGRPPEFDQKRDSIVRVEAYRLRKRLREFYENEGASHEIQIQIPSGQYTPKFVTVNAPAENPVGAADTLPQMTSELVLAPLRNEIVAPPSLPEETLGNARPALPKFWIAVALTVIALASLFLVFRGNRQISAPATGGQVSLAPAGEEIRILCGVESGSYIDVFERTWLSDRYFAGGYPAQAPRSQIVLGTRDQQLFHRSREGQFRYDIPVKPGVYELRLYFAETVYGDNNVAGGGETTRLFEIHLNGQTLESYFDVIADAGPSTADVKVYKNVSPGTDNKIHLEFLSNVNKPFLNAIEILPGIPGLPGTQGKMRPYRIVAREHGIRDNLGRNWDPDRYARGGQVIPRPDSNVQNADPELFRGERFGNLVYSLPVPAPGRYSVNLYFAENWFGPDNPGGGGVGSRTFDIIVNGVMLRKQFDILRESGGNSRAVIVSLHSVEPNHQGKIVISLVPNQNYACINALEVLDESR